MDLFEYFVAHDGHPCEGCKEEKLVEVSQNCATNLGKLASMVLVDDKNEEGKKKRNCKVDHDLVIA